MAGVAAALGKRYEIDPIVIRIALIALTAFGGFGLPAYLLGWLVFPVENDEVSAFESLFGTGHSSVSKAFTLILCLALVPVSGWTFTSHWLDGAGFFGLALLVTALYLLHHTRGHRNRPMSPWSVGSDTNAHSGGFATATTGSFGPPPEDPLGATPLGWDLSNTTPSTSSTSATPPIPSPPSPPRRTRRFALGFVTFGIALVVGGVGTVLGAGDVSWFTPAHIVGLVLGVLGSGMVLGAFLGGGRGLVGLAIPLALAGVLLTVVPVTDFAQGTGHVNATPYTAEEVSPEYARTAGSIDLDLRELEESDSVTTRLNASVGEIVVTVPENADITYTCTTRVGELDCLGQEKSGVGIDPIQGNSTSTADEGPDITLDATTIAGSVEVRRG